MALGAWTVALFTEKNFVDRGNPLGADRIRAWAHLRAPCACTRLEQARNFHLVRLARSRTLCAPVMPPRVYGDHSVKLRRIAPFSIPVLTPIPVASGPSHRLGKRLCRFVSPSTSGLRSASSDRRASSRLSVPRQLVKRRLCASVAFKNRYSNRVHIRWITPFCPQNPRRLILSQAVVTLYT